MKPRRIPAKAERVYTYNLPARSLKKETKKPDVEVHINEHDDITREEYVKEASQSALNPPKQVTNTREEEGLAKYKLNNDQIFAWGDTDEETSTFYDEMLEHETGDAHPNESAPIAHKTHNDEVQPEAQTDFLNTTTEKTGEVSAEQKNDVSQVEKVARPSSFDGNPDEAKTNRYDA